MVIASALGGIIIQYIPGGWPNVFYIFGVVGILWYVVWCCICFNDPSSHPYITDEEKKYLQETIGRIERRKVSRMLYIFMLNFCSVHFLFLSTSKYYIEIL